MKAAASVSLLAGALVVSAAACSSGQADPPESKNPACASGQLTVTASTMSPGSMHRGVRLNFSLPEGSSCVLTGYPGVDSGAGGPLLHADRTLRGYLGGLPSGSDELPVVTVSPGHDAHAVVEGLATNARGDQCPTYTDLRVTPPNTTDVATVSATIDTCALQVHPVTAS